MSELVVSPGKLRRIALERQGLLRNAPFGRGRAAALRALEQLGYVQIDTISVVERAHHHVLRNRVPNFKEQHLQRLLTGGEAFEYWSHAAAFLPMRDYRFSLPRKQTYRDGLNHWARSRDEKLMREVVTRIRSEGPLRSRDFEHAAGGNTGWWDWKPAKRALEQLFMQGDLMVAAREGFQKTYDLTERVLPNDVDTSCPDASEYASHLLDSGLRANGFVNQAMITYLRKGSALRTQVQAELQARVDDDQLLAFRLPGGQQYFGLPELLAGTAPRAPRRVRILSPFDNLVIQRQRTAAVFGFDFQIECYVPEAKREFGYFCLPILYADKLVGRMDCKAHRREGELELKSLHIESRQPLDTEFAAALAKALQRFAVFNHCDEIVLPAHHADGLRSQLESALGRL
jgi:uncharacterized protein YcaQ